MQYKLILSYQLIVTRLANFRRVRTAWQEDSSKQLFLLALKHLYFLFLRTMNLTWDSQSYVTCLCLSHSRISFFINSSLLWFNDPAFALTTWAASFDSRVKQLKCVQFSDKNNVAPDKISDVVPIGLYCGNKYPRLIMGVLVVPLLDTGVKTLF